VSVDYTPEQPLFLRITTYVNTYCMYVRARMDEREWLHVSECSHVVKCDMFYCSALQCVAVCCSVLQCVAVCCSVLTLLGIACV